MIGKPFELGFVVVSPGAVSAFKETGQDWWEFLFLSHAVGDWGEVSPERAAANDQAVREGGVISSAYNLKNGQVVHVITGSDRTVTVIRLADEADSLGSDPSFKGGS